jgi:hypothetical protein
MNASKKRETIQEQWRNLGFFYNKIDKEKVWFLAGSKEGLLKFYDILISYAGDPQYNEISAHEHYGPYMYLEIMTWEKPEINGHSIQGSKQDLRMLAELFVSKLRETSAGHHFIIGSDYAADNEYSILVEVKEEGFDPAMLDTIN